MHALIPIIHISRSGEAIAEFDDERDILNGLREGTLLMDDSFWCEGMPEWTQLLTLEISKSALATTAQKEALKAAGLSFNEPITKAQVSALFSESSHGPASPEQLALLSYLAIPVPENLSKKEATKLIDDTVPARSDGENRFGDWNEDKLILFPDIYADEIAECKKECFADYKAFREELGPAKSQLPRISLEQASRIFAYLDKNEPGWMKPRAVMCLHHFLPCVESKIHPSPTDS